MSAPYSFAAQAPCATAGADLRRAMQPGGMTASVREGGGRQPGRRRAAVAAEEEDGGRGEGQLSTSAVFEYDSPVAPARAAVYGGGDGGSNSLLSNSGGKAGLPRRLSPLPTKSTGDLLAKLDRYLARGPLPDLPRWQRSCVMCLPMARHTATAAGAEAMARPMAGRLRTFQAKRGL
jgi:hypothetical protein